ncbi:MAG: PEP-CTERM sorting domain-containing protein [Pirellulaceae bacterium]
MTSFSSPENLFSRQTGYRTASYTFTPGGDFTFGFGIVNVTDTTFSSGLLIDSVSLTAVPEPTALAGLGMVGLALTLRRRRKEG